MKTFILVLFGSLVLLNACNSQHNSGSSDTLSSPDSTKVEKEESIAKLPTIADLVIEKDFLYDQHTLEDSYPYKDTVRVFQWDKIRQELFYLDSIQTEPAFWGIIQNYKNRNGEAPLIKNHVRNAYKRVSDAFGVERYQSVPFFLPTDTSVAERYGRDGSPVKYIRNEGNYVLVENMNFPGKWLIPKKYYKPTGDTISYQKVIIVDRTNQNIATFEKIDSKWLVRSMNPATTGVHNPPYSHETPLGLFVIQEKKPKMIYLKDGSQETGGFAPYASRFTNGGYTHGVPINAPGTRMVEFSQTLGTTPRSHMCVRNATSHAKFIYDWAPALKSVVIVIE